MTRLRRALALALLLPVLAGCAGLPREGPVRQGGDRSFAAAAEEPAVRRLAPPPRAGAGPLEIVRGFLLASAGTEDDAATARRYLTATAGSRWRPEAGVSILQSNPELTADDDEVTMAARQVGAIDDSNGYRVVDPAKAVSVDFGLRQEPRDRGEWRIAALPDGLFLPRYEVDRVFRSLNAYYLTARQDRLVPEPVVFPATENLAAALVRRLLRGPGAALSPVVTNAVPVGSVLEDGTVPLREGVADVALRAPAIPGTLDREALSAQLAYTLRQIPGITAVRLTLNGTTVETPGAGSPQRVTAWERYDPDGMLPADPPVYATVSGRLVQLDGGAFVPLAGGPGTRRLDVRTPAASLDGTSIAAVSTDGTALRAGRLGQAEPPEVRLRGTDLGDPSFDVSGTLWVLDRGGDETDGGDPVLWALPAGGRPIAVTLPDLGGRVVQVRVSRDGLQLAIISRRGSRDELFTAVLLRPPASGGRLQISVAREVAPQFRAVRDVAWRDVRTLAVLAAESGSVVQPYVLGADGFASEAISPVPGNALTITAAGGAPLLVGAEGRRIFQASGRTWRERARASDPAYPG